MIGGSGRSVLEIAITQYFEPRLHGPILFWMRIGHLVAAGVRSATWPPRAVLRLVQGQRWGSEFINLAIELAIFDLAARARTDSDLSLADAEHNRRAAYWDLMDHGHQWLQSTFRTVIFRPGQPSSPPALDGPIPPRPDS